ncbi:hypothetical protein PHMEG_00019662 [Phytophthora megakarya]|uniref:Uncharacterized protein n=1 Tax=Phytophthora megakarya TaxID=4795 RepID=A0A225VTM1_9STRA|nr:hypothetical protein PHMEG_00019662 [Phytophthora megakarya]
MHVYKTTKPRQSNFDSQETTVQLAQSSETSQTIDSRGIPTSVAYIRQNGSATVWNHMRKLKIPIKSARKNTIFTHICILCADDLNAKNSRDPELWRGALFRIPHSSNAWKHMKKIHNTHAVFESKIKGDIRRAEKAIIADEELVASVLGKRTVPNCDEKPICEVIQASSCDRSQTADVTQHASQTSGGYRRISDHFRLNSRQIGTTIF